MENKNNIRQILMSWLFENGYDGLYNNEVECGCLWAGDFIPCECPHEIECKAGVIIRIEDDGLPIIGPDEK